MCSFSVFSRIIESFLGGERVYYESLLVVESDPFQNKRFLARFLRFRMNVVLLIKSYLHNSLECGIPLLCRIQIFNFSLRSPDQ